MPLETASFISQLVSTNPAGTDSEAQGDDHLRLIKACLQATFPNFTAAALNSTQAAIDAVATAFTAGTWPLGAGTVGAPALHLLSDATTGVYSTGAGHIDVAISGVQLLDLSSAGLNLTSGSLLFGGVAVFPLASSAYGAGSVLTAALGNSQVTYAKIQNETASTLLGNPTGGSAAPSEITLGTGLSFAGSVLNAAQFLPVATVKNLLIVNDGTSPSTKVNITADYAILDNNAGGYIQFKNISVSVDTTALGANGMGSTTGTRTANAAYFWWLISNGTLIKALGSTHSDLAGMLAEAPSGYTYGKLLDGNFTDASSNLLRVRTNRNRSQYVITAGSNTTGMPDISGGQITSDSAWHSFSVTGKVPANAIAIGLAWILGGGQSAAAPNNSYATIASGSGVTTTPPIWVGAGSANITGISWFLLESTNIFGCSSGNGNHLLCLGWENAAGG